VTERQKHSAVGRKTIVLYGALGLALGLAGCSSGGNEGKAPTAASVAPSSSAPVDPDAADRAAVLSAYKGLTDAESRTYATAKLDPQLETYAAHKALADIKVTLVYQQQHGTVMRGTVKRDPKVTALNTGTVPLKAVVTDCADSSQYNEVITKTSKTVPYSGPRRHVVTATAERSKTGPWKFYTYVIERDRTC